MSQNSWNEIFYLIYLFIFQLTAHPNYSRLICPPKKQLFKSPDKNSCSFLWQHIAEKQNITISVVSNIVQPYNPHRFIHTCSVKMTLRWWIAFFTVRICGTVTALVLKCAELEGKQLRVWTDADFVNKNKS